MATARVHAAVTGEWVNLIGAAAGVPKVTWQNVSDQYTLLIAFTTTAPAGGATHAFHRLKPGEAFYDETGSAQCWVRAPAGRGTICATSA